MKHLIALGSILIGLSGVAAGAQLHVSLSPWQSGYGGEFQITPIIGYAGLVGLPSDVASNTFQTFCVETNETLGAANYFYTLDPGAIHGGVAGGDPDPISPATGWLYYNFRMGNLAWYDYTNTGVGRATSAGLLQSAIWTLENEPDLNNSNAGAVTSIVNAALAAVGNSQDTYGVRVLNLYTVSNGVVSDNQSVLTIIPLPTAAWMGLSGLGLVALRRRRS